jgi:hypothetical protein
LKKNTKMRYRNRARFFPGIFAGLFLLLVAGSICLHFFFPYHYHYGFFPFGGFFIWPGFLFFALLFFLVRRFFWGGGWGYAGHGYSGPWHGYNHGYSGPWDRGQFQGYRHGNEPFVKTGSRASDDFVEMTSGFGTVERKVSSRNFQGGDITTVMGEALIDLRAADITGAVRLKVTQVRGVTTILVPPHWEIKAEVDTVAAGFRDNRPDRGVVNPNKVLIIDGTCMMGGLEVRTS